MLKVSSFESWHQGFPLLHQHVTKTTKHQMSAEVFCYGCNSKEKKQPALFYF